MDDFIYGEPIPAPAGLLAALGGLGMLSRRRR
jgi:MYXO-CTERM domain-containing protein